MCSRSLLCDEFQKILFHYSIYQVTVYKIPLSNAPTKGEILTQRTGKIDYGMRNNYMFRAVLQENKTVLTGLVCSLLHLSADQVTSITVTNPIKPGEAISDK